MALRISPDEYRTFLARTGAAESALPASPPSPTSKYHAKKTTVDGIAFASKGEASRYQMLKLEQQVGAISNLRLQVPYPCTVNDRPICTYIADFVYIRDGAEVVEDFKGFRTPEYKLKKKLVEALHGITILETGTTRRRRAWPVHK